jgi:hypothetical protein
MENSERNNQRSDRRMIIDTDEDKENVNPQNANNYSKYNYN